MRRVEREFLAEESGINYDDLFDEYSDLAKEDFVREIRFKYYVKLSEEENNRIIPLVFTIEEIEREYDFDNFIGEKVYEILHKEYCTCLINESTPHCGCEREWDDDYEVIDRCEYTGLKDKNGVDIYEGDTVRIEDNGDTKYEIKWVNSRCSFEIFTINPKKDEWENAKSDEDEDPKLCEVMGNIYEDPELLEND